MGMKKKNKTKKKQKKKKKKKTILPFSSDKLERANFPCQPGYLSR